MLSYLARFEKKTIGLHSKVFIIDNSSCYYVGSQNLYLFDLCEFGVVINECLKINLLAFLAIATLPYCCSSFSFSFLFKIMYLF